MNLFLPQFKVYWIRVCITMLLLTLCRFIFLAYNLHSFQNITIVDAGKVFFFALRFDMVAAMYLNTLFFILLSISFQLNYNKIYQKILVALYVLMHVPLLVLELIDAIFYPYNLRRSTFGITKVGDEAAGQWKTYVSFYWWLFIVLFVLLFLVWFLANKTNKKYFTTKPILNKKYFANWIICFLISGGLSFLMIRGGWQYIPISGTTAGEMVDEKYSPLVTNSTVIFFQSAFLPQIKPVKYYTDEECKKIFTNQIYITKNDTLEKILHRKPNVMIIIWESCGKEYVGHFNKGKNFTPFLDSLCNNSLLCTNAFANAKHSHEGMCAIMASIPTMMEECFYYSSYQNNKIKGMGEYMKEMGYTTAFFHGGNNGSMKFNSFSRRCGFDTYYGRDEYPEPDKDFDGTWGIWDHKYFQYVAKKINEMPEPFCTGLFTLSSHNPFKIPEEFANKFPKDENVLLQPIAYTDYSLRKFFETASKMKWFNNTLFVIVGDHTAWNTDPNYSGDAGVFKLPMLFYMPGKLKGNINFVTQQVDILPTVLNMVGYQGKVAAFGRNILQQDSATAKTFTWLNNNFLLMDNNLTIRYNGNKLLSAFTYKTDKACTENVLITHQQKAEQMSTYLKAVIQTYNEGLLKNRLYPIEK
ncbi:MAG: hypothetical protein RJA07_2662 [Bacteroidota bacterium]|jgi:phosphoglycerol transferase MdoB-like AlkP superfamily enzyme